VDDYVRAGDEVGRRPLENAVGLGERELDWLRAHSEPNRRAEVALVADAHESYTTTLTQLVAKGKGRYRLTPGMELVQVIEQPPAPLPGMAPPPPQPAVILEAARTLVQELRRCAA